MRYALCLSAGRQALCDFPTNGAPFLVPSLYLLVYHTPDSFPASSPEEVAQIVRWLRRTIGLSTGRLCALLSDSWRPGRPVTPDANGDI